MFESYSRYIISHFQMRIQLNTVEDGHEITKNILGKHKVIYARTTIPMYKYLGFFMYLKWPWLLHFFAKML
jgi:hypothetical protein